VARDWKTVRAEARTVRDVDEDRLAEIRRRMMAEVRAQRLAELRSAYGLNQIDIAERLGLSQSRVSRIEQGDLDHTEISTVRCYVAALGGEVEIVAKFGDERITVG